MMMINSMNLINRG